MKANHLRRMLVLGSLLTVLALLAGPTLGLASSQSVPATQLEPLDVQALAYQVTLQTSSKASLTPLASLRLRSIPLDAAQQETLLNAIRTDERYRDLALVNTTKGERYLYSRTHMSATYARLLLRVEENDPYLLIGETVRENSEIYPRPTPVDLFKLPLFKLPPTEVERLARETVERQEYRDLHVIVTSTGVLYLNSSRYMDPEFARSIAELEVHLSGHP